MYEDTCYKTNYLTDVVARIDFVVPVGGFERTLPSELSNVASKAFPIAEPVDVIGVEFQIGKEGEKPNQTRQKEWQFHGKQREKLLAISSQSIYVIYKKYATYEAVKTEFAAIVRTAAKQLPEMMVKRFGLRYVNKITSEGSTKLSTFSGMIAPELLASAKFFKDPKKLTRLFHVAELKYGDVDLRYQFGFPNPDYPAAMKRPEFIIDLDGYVQVSHELNESLQYMDAAHDIIQGLFESSITNALRKKMMA